MDWLNDHEQSTTRVVISDLGIISYYTDVYIIDSMFLISPAIKDEISRGKSVEMLRNEILNGNDYDYNYVIDFGHEIDIHDPNIVRSIGNRFLLRANNSSIN